MAVPRFIFHIGGHKTGTTFLQAVFHTLTPALAKRGVLVPAVWHRLPHQPGHHQLPIDLMAGSLPSLRRDVEGMMDSGCSEVIVSAEGLSVMRDQHVALLASLLKGVDASFVFHCRRWSDYFPSHWQTAVRGGIYDTLPENLHPFLREPRLQSAVNFGIKLNHYARIFGRDRVSVVSYSNIIDAGGNLAHHFFEAFLPAHRAVFDANPKASELASNMSFSTVNIEMIRALNMLARKHGEKRGAGPGVWLMRTAEKDDVDRFHRMLESAGRVITVDDDAPRLRALHAALFQEWGDRLVEPRSGDRFFEPRTRELRFIAPSRVQAPVVAKALLALYDQYRRDTGLPPRAE